ncbi:MAG: hypothetical protein AAF363_21730 [Bacteroidota bacterium]
MNRLNFLILLLIICSCVSKVDITNFNDEIWKEGLNGCDSKRSALINALLSEKQKLINLTQNEVKALLGAPDEHQLYTRNQKFFKYYIQPSPNCAKPVEGAQYLQIRFNALGYVSEVNYSE